eukprot:Seg2316.3 transcript_id=Seg2316.3/GoldUCD/mRNA.D3Y31 product="hypothetical protein" protein_id=Seg2316.3/GoldUCD/D3Y31
MKGNEASFATLLIIIIINSTAGKWPTDQQSATSTRSIEANVKRSIDDSKRDLTNNPPEEFSGSGESPKTDKDAEGSGMHMLKDFMLSEVKAKGQKGDPGRKQSTLKENHHSNMRKHGNINKHEFDKNHEIASKTGHTSHKLKGDNGDDSSRNDKKKLHSFFGDDVVNSRDSTPNKSRKISEKLPANSDVIKHLRRVDEERRKILTSFDKSQKEGSGESGDHSSDETTTNEFHAENDQNPSDKTTKDYEKHRQLFQELSQFFPGDKNRLAETEQNLRPKRNHLEEMDSWNNDDPPEEYDENEEEDYDDSDHYETEGFVKDISDNEIYDEFDSMPRYRRDVESAQGNSRTSKTGTKRKLNPYPTPKFDEYGNSESAATPSEVPYDQQKSGLNYHEPADNSLRQISNKDDKGENMEQKEIEYQRMKEEYEHQIFGLKSQGPGSGSGEYTSDTRTSHADEMQQVTESSDEDGSGVQFNHVKGNSGSVDSHNGKPKGNRKVGPTNILYLKDDSGSGTHKSTLTEASPKVTDQDTNSQTAAQHLNMLGPKVGTDQGKPKPGTEVKTWTEEKHHKNGKRKRKHHKKAKDELNSQQQAQLNKQTERGASNLKYAAPNQQKLVPKEGYVPTNKVDLSKTKPQEAKAELNLTKVHVHSKTPTFSTQLGKIGEAKSRRKRIKLVMEKRKRKAARSLGTDSFNWHKDIKASKRSRIGQALLSAALKESAGNFEDEKRSHINLRPKSMSPREMVLDSVRFPKRKGKRATDEEEENLMDLQEHETEHEAALVSLKSNPDKPTTKTRRDIPTRNAVKTIIDYIDDDTGSGDNDSEESGTEDEEEANKAKETAQILAVSTIGPTSKNILENKRADIPKADGNMKSSLIDDKALNEQSSDGASEDIVERSAGEENTSDDSSEDSSEISPENSNEISPENSSEVSPENSSEISRENSKKNPAEQSSEDSTVNSSENASENSKAPIEEDESDTEEFRDTRTKINNPSLSLYNGTDEYDDNSEARNSKDSLGLTDIDDVEEAHINGPSAYYTMEKDSRPAQTASYRSEIEDPDSVPSQGPTNEVNSIWNEAKIADEKLANIPYPTGDSNSRSNVFISENGIRKGEPGTQHSELNKINGALTKESDVEEIGSKEHKGLISDVMSNVNSDIKIAPKLSGRTIKQETDAKTDEDIPVIKTINTRRLSKPKDQSSIDEFDKGTVKSIDKFPVANDDKNEFELAAESEEAARKGSVAIKQSSKKNAKNTEKSVNSSEKSPDKEVKQINKLDDETFNKLKSDVEKEKQLKIRNKTWEAEVNSLFPGKTNQSFVMDDTEVESSLQELPEHKQEADEGNKKELVEAESSSNHWAKNGPKPEGKENSDAEDAQQDIAEWRTTPTSMKTFQEKHPTSKETMTDGLEKSTKRQCVGISVADCIGAGPDAVTLNVPVNGQEFGVQVNGARVPGMIYPTSDVNFPAGFQQPTPPEFRQFPGAIPGGMTNMLQDGSIQPAYGFNNNDVPINSPGAYPDHYPSNVPNMPQSKPVFNKKPEVVPTMKPSEHSIHKAGGKAKKKKKPKSKSTTPKPKKTTKCPNCDKSKKVKSSGGKKIPFTDKLWKVIKKKRTTTTTAQPPTTMTEATTTT